MATFVPLVKESRFQCKVKNALLINRLESDEFALSGHRWRLHVCADAAGYLNVSLNKLNPEKLNWILKVRAFIQDRNGKPVVTNVSDLDDPDFTTRGIWYTHKSDLQMQRDTYLADGTLTFVIAFTRKNSLQKDSIHEKVSDKSIQTSDNGANLENLSLDLRRLLDDGVQSDVTLKCGESSFPAHKGILSVRSEVFSAMFRSDMAESRTGVIQISDVDASILDQFLHYLYSGKLPDLSADTAPELYATADKYCIESLKKPCAKFMQKNLTRENACRILVLAETHADKCLKDSALCFITKAELLRNKDVWVKFHNEHPKLAAEVLHHAYEVKCLSGVN